MWKELITDLKEINPIILWGGLLFCALLAFEIPEWIRMRKCKMIAKAIRKEFLE